MSKQASGSGRPEQCGRACFATPLDPKPGGSNGSSGCVEQPVPSLSHQRREASLGCPCFSNPWGPGPLLWSAIGCDLIGSQRLHSRAGSPGTKDASQITLDPCPSAQRLSAFKTIQDRPAATNGSQCPSPGPLGPCSFDL